MDELGTSSAPSIHSEGFFQRVPIHPLSAEPNRVDSSFSYIFIPDLGATSTSATGLDPDLGLKIQEAELFITRLRHYWAAVADDLGPLMWAQPTNVHRQIWEQEISAAYRKLQTLLDQIPRTASRTYPNFNEDPLSSRLRDIDKNENRETNAHDFPHCLLGESKVVHDEERKASNKRTMRRKATRQRAKARLSATKASSAISLTTAASASSPRWVHDRYDWAALGDVEKGAKDPRRIIP